jgi:hypothetical protein
MSKSTTHKATQPKSTAPKPLPAKLTVAQRIVLSSAADRSDGAATLPDGTSGKAAEKLAAALIEKGLFREVRAKADLPVWRRSEEGRGYSLIITKLGRGAAESDAGDRQNDAEGAFAESTPSPTVSVLPSETAASQPDRTAPRPGSKIAEVIVLLERKEGVGIQELMTLTGWLAHTTRAALTGLRKRGFGIERERSEHGGSVYRIVTPAAATLVA